MDSAREQTIGDEIRERRDALGMSIEELAFKAHISYKTIERIEAGGNPRRATLFLIKQALDAEEKLERAA